MPESSLDKLAGAIRNARTGRRPATPDVPELARQVMTEAATEAREAIRSVMDEMTRLTDELLSKHAGQVSDVARQAVLDQRTQLLHVMSNVTKSLRDAEISIVDRLKP